MSDDSPERVLRDARRLAGASSVLGAASLALYLIVILGEGDNPTGRTTAWAIAMAAPTALALVLTAVGPSVARWTLTAATVLFVPLIVLFSLGIGFLAAGVLSGVAAIKLHAGSVDGRHASQVS